MSANNLLYRPEDENDSRPFVEIIVARLGGKLRAVEKHYGRFYCIADWVHHVSGSTDKDRYKAWNDLKLQMERQHALDDGRMYVDKYNFSSSNKSTVELDGCDETGLYYIFQFIFQEEVNETVKAVRKYLAQAGVALDIIRRDPDSALDFVIDRYESLGKTPRWIQSRINGQIARQKFMDALTYALIEISSSKWEYGKATNTVYVGLWGRAAEVLKDQLNVKKRGSLRDNLSTVALSYLTIAESFCAMQLGDQQDLTYAQADVIIRRVATLIGSQVKEAQKMTGKDMITGWEILPDNDDYYEKKIDELGQRQVGDDGKFIQ